MYTSIHNTSYTIRGLVPSRQILGFSGRDSLNFFYILFPQLFYFHLLQLFFSVHYLLKKCRKISLFCAKITHSWKISWFKYFIPYYSGFSLLFFFFWLILFYWPACLCLILYSPFFFTFRLLHVWTWLQVYFVLDHATPRSWRMWILLRRLFVILIRNLIYLYLFVWTWA